MGFTKLNDTLCYQNLDGEEDENQNPTLNQRSNSSKNGQLDHEKKPLKSPTIMDDHKWEWNWLMVATMIFLHTEALIGLVLGVTHAQISTLVWYFILIQFGATGIICGAHRLWTHRTFKANVWFRTYLMLCNTLALQESIYDWSHWHRVHHKFSDTDADPHNAKRGFFFSQIGWVMVKPHPEYLAKSKIIDMTDLDADQVVQFQKKYYVPLVFFVWFVIPVSVPWYFWSENLIVCISFNFFRYLLSLHQTSLVNSAAHIFGDKIYDKRLMPTKQYFTTAVTMGEAYHNYHHAFPWDYSASEFGWNINYNPMTAVIDCAAAMGMAWDRKKASGKLVEERIRKYGDIDKLEMKTRIPTSVLLDTLHGVFWLFWALWIILALKAIYVYCGFQLVIPGIEHLIQFCDKNDSLKLMAEKLWDIGKSQFNL